MKINFGKRVGKDTKKETSKKFSLLDASNSQAAPVDNKALMLPVPSPTACTSKDNIGLFELSLHGSEKSIDIIAVHGLQGDAYKTWQHDNGWLRDFLPADIPNARIMAFGYNSTVTFSKSVAKIEDKALELLNHLSSKRSSPAASNSLKPIVFICHSLGGIIVKKSACSGA